MMTAMSPNWHLTYFEMRIQVHKSDSTLTSNDLTPQMSSLVQFSHFSGVDVARADNLQCRLSYLDAGRKHQQQGLVLCEIKS